MLCTCGKKLVYKGVDNGCHVLACPGCEGKSYRIPVIDPRTLISPCEMVLVKVKVYACRGCRARIEEEQAKRTFDEKGRALCESCVNQGRII